VLTKSLHFRAGSVSDGSSIRRLRFRLGHTTYRLLNTSHVNVPLPKTPGALLTPLISTNNSSPAVTRVNKSTLFFPLTSSARSISVLLESTVKMCNSRPPLVAFSTVSAQLKKPTCCIDHLNQS